MTDSEVGRNHMTLKDKDSARKKEFGFTHAKIEWLKTFKSMSTIDKKTRQVWFQERYLDWWYIWNQSHMGSNWAVGNDDIIG